MDNYHEDAEGNLKRLYDQESLLDILIEFEAILDSMDLYAFKNWIEGEIIKGPNLKRYWVTVTFKYPWKKMPDPRGGMRLVKHGAKIKYITSSEELTVNLEDYRDDPSDAYEHDPKTNQQKRKTETVKVWLIEIKLPRRFIEDMEKGQVSLDNEDDEFVDLEAADDAENQGLDDESIVAGEGEEAEAQEFENENF